MSQLRLGSSGLEPAGSAGCVLIASSGTVLAGIADPEAELSEAERARAAVIINRGSRLDFVAGHLLVRRCMRDLLGGAEGVIEQRCAHCGGPHGRPVLRGRPEIGLSLAHSHGWVAAVAAQGRVGIDLERRIPERTELVSERALAPAERRWLAARDGRWSDFLRLWVRKEALVKAGVTTLDQADMIDLVGTSGQIGSHYGDFALSGWEESETIGAVAFTAGGGSR